MKYDCTKSLDYSHELKRLCLYGEPTFSCLNYECPLRSKGCFLITVETVAILQEWSDEHPEKPKLTKREYEFLKTFLISMDTVVVRGRLMNDLYFYDARCDTHYAIDPTMFSFIQELEHMTVEELLKLEVEE